MKKPKFSSRRSRSWGDANSLVLYSKDDGDYVNSNHDSIRVHSGASRSLSPNHHNREEKIPPSIGQGLKSLSPGKWMKKKFKTKRGENCSTHGNSNNGGNVGLDDDCKGGIAFSSKKNVVANNTYYYAAATANYAHTIKKNTSSQECRDRHDSKKFFKRTLGLQQQQNHQQTTKTTKTTTTTNNASTSKDKHTNHIPNVMEDATESQQPTEYHNHHRQTDDNDSEHGHDEESSVCTQETNVVDIETSRLSTIVWKRKSGFSGIMKSGYVKASEKANELSMKSVTNFQKLTQSLNPNNMHNHAHNHPTGPALSPTSQSGSVGSGGLPNTIKIWEERRIVLEGGILMYYHKDADLNVIGGRETTEDNLSPANNTPSAILGTRASIMAKNKQNLAKLKNKFMEFSQGNFINSENAGNTENDQAKSAASNSAINTPRGLIDLVATGATASVTHFTQHSHAPSPYSLSVNVKNEPKWVMCFSSSKELLDWLGALTDISLKQSVESYETDHGHAFHTNENENINEDVKAESKQSSVISSHSNDRVNDEESNESNESNDSVGNDDESELERNEAVDEITPLLGPAPKFVIPQRTCHPTKGCVQGSFRTMAILNGALLTVSLLLNNVSLMVLIAQSVMNGLAWSYYHCTNVNNFDPADDDDSDLLPPQLNVVSSTNAIRSSMASPRHRNTTRGRTFSCGDYDVKEQPSFVEVSKVDPPVVVSNDPPYKPPAGGTMLHFENESEASKYGGDMLGYISAPSSLLPVRGMQYLDDKKKVPSPPSLYELVAVDLFDSNQHMLDVGTQFELPKLKFDSPKGPWRAPDLLIISFALPTSPPKIGKASDNKGYIVVGYYKMREETRKILGIISNNILSSSEKERQLQELCPNDNEHLKINGVKLWEKWCQCAPTDQEMQKRLKFIPRGENLKELGVPSWICKYNGKPMLIKRPGVTNFVYSHQNGNIIEIDVNMHPLPYLFRQAMTYLKEHYFSQILMTFGFVIEARESDELPEVLLGNPLQLPTVNPANVTSRDAIFKRPSF